MRRRSHIHPPGRKVSPPRLGSTAGPAGHSSSSSVSRRERWWACLVCLLLALAVWMVFGQTLRHEFVNYDSNIYVYENPDVSAGLSLKGVLWAFTHVHVDEWWPLTTISHMVDCQFFGLNPAGHHLTNVLLHGATVILLFLVLRNMTGALWRSACVAAVFAIHPLRVESVAWVTERKDVLSGLFFVLTLGAYVRYARRPFALGRYLLVSLLFTLGMLSKAILATVPFLLLLLDYWPLRRLSGGSGQQHLNARLMGRLLLEKIPFLLLAAGGSATTILAVGEVHPFEELSLPWRIANAVVAYATYLKQMIYPVGLAVFYPHPENRLLLRMVAAAALVLFIISAGVVAGWRRRPYLLVGWLWYLGMLVPVIGLVQVGSQSHADRYTYLPQIGVYIAVVWGVWDLFGDWRHRRLALGAVAIAVLAALGIRAYGQTRYWRDSVTLWTHTLDCTSENHVAHNNLGGSLADHGKLEEAIAHYERAVQLKPAYAEAHYNLGVTLMKQGKPDDAILHYERALRFKPNYVAAYNNLGNALVAQGRLAEAVKFYERALQLNPNMAEAHYNLGNALSKQGKSEEAIQSYQRAIEVKHDYAEAHYNLANRLAAQGKMDEAAQHNKRAVELKPNSPEAYNNLGNRLTAQRKWDEAVQSFEQALRLKPDYAEARNGLGAALAGQGKLDEAIQQYEAAMQLKPDYVQARANLGNALVLKGKADAGLEHLHEALNLAVAQTNAPLAEAILARLKVYQSGVPPAEAP